MMQDHAETRDMADLFISEFGDVGDLFTTEPLTTTKRSLTWDQLVVVALHVIRCRDFTQYNPKTYLTLPTRFCQHNIAFFDLDNECKLSTHNTTPCFAFLLFFMHVCRQSICLVLISV